MRLLLLLKMSGTPSKGPDKTKSTAKNTAKGKEAKGKAPASSASQKGYDASRFLGVHEDKAYRTVWVLNGAVIEREIRLNAFRTLEWDREFANRGWLELASYKGECILTLCAEFMANISSLIAEQGREQIKTWVRGKEII